MWHRLETIVAVVVSVMALVLSQLPPLHTYFSKPWIAITLPSRPVISHRFGHLYACCFVQASNQGDAPGTIDRIRLYLASKDSGGMKQVFTASSIRDYSKSNEARKPLDLPLGEVTIQPGETWEGQVVFTPAMAARDEEELAKFEDEIFSQIRLSGKMSIIDRDLYKSISAYSNDHLKALRSGEYYLLLAASEAGGPEHLLLYSFPIYPFDLRQLERITEKYRVGYGVTSFDDVYALGFQARVAAVRDQALGRRIYAQINHGQTDE